MFFGDPLHVKTRLARTLGVKPEDVQRVLRTYIVARPAVIVSTVPKGRVDLAASGRTREQVTAEGAIERAKQPGASERPTFQSPAVWHARLENGVEAIGSRFDELPLSRFQISVPAGHLRESMEDLGLSSLTAAMLQEGTKELSNTELQDAFDALGATFSVFSSDDEISISVSTLDKHLPQAVALVQDVLLEPRFAPQDFARVQKEALTDLAVRGDNIRAIAGDAWSALMYGADTVAGQPGAGTEQTVAKLGIDDVQAFWKAHAQPNGARLCYVGALDAQGVTKLFAPLTSAWRGAQGAVAEASFKDPEMRFPEKTAIYVVDKPGAAQSEIRIGHPGVSAVNPVAWDLSILNYPLGGSFTSRINLNLREDKGYTYGARSSFDAGLHPAPFTASAGVRTDVTAESVVEFLKELRGITTGVRDDELAFARQSIAQSMNRQFESTGALLAFVDQISQLGYPDDFPTRRLARIDAITKEELDRLAQEYIQPDRMAVLVVGDKEKVLPGLTKLGYDVIELDRFGRPLEN
jgi:zinc protease